MAVILMLTLKMCSLIRRRGVTFVIVFTKKKKSFFFSNASYKVIYLQALILIEGKRFNNEFSSLYRSKKNYVQRAIFFSCPWVRGKMFLFRTKSYELDLPSLLCLPDNWRQAKHNYEDDFVFTKSIFPTFSFYG